MTEKQRGTADVTLVLWVDQPAAVDFLIRRFGRNAQDRGTLVVEDNPEVRPAETGGLFVALSYQHTAKNYGNGEWDARRFYEKAVEGAPFRFHLYRVDVNDWSPV
ncbi:MAG TPA: hypothetical protein VGJ44_09620 [Kribbellaceae bacterium]|jgi:hypothetical protein